MYGSTRLEKRRVGSLELQVCSITCQERSLHQDAPDVVPMVIVSFFGKFYADRSSRAMLAESAECSWKVRLPQARRQIFDNTWKKEHNTIA